MNSKAIRRQQEAEYCRVEEDAFYANPTDETRYRAQRKRAEFDWYKIKEHSGVEEWVPTKELDLYKKSFGVEE